MKFLSTLSLRRATLPRLAKILATAAISIHALLAESDHYDNYNLHCTEISIHALLAESDSISNIINNVINNFYPRSPCGERPYIIRYPINFNPISIHALLAESDPSVNVKSSP